jgi:cytochrome c peroxidase
LVAHYKAALDSLDASLATLDSAIARPGRRARAGQQEFRRARAAYKRIEYLAEYYVSWVARDLNGPNLSRTEYEDPDTPLPPLGFQVVEAALFPEARSEDREKTRELIANMRRSVGLLRRFGADTLSGDSYAFDAMRQEVARITTLGLAGFDASVSGNAILEAASALMGLREGIDFYVPGAPESARRAILQWQASVDSAVAYLRAHPDFNGFDRLIFIARYANPAAHALVDVQRALGIPVPPSVVGRERAWSTRAASIFDRDAIDPRFFAPRDAPQPTPALIDLGRSLFFDPRMSPSGTRACATCHLPARGFTDGQARPKLLAPHDTKPGRNTPTLINAALQPVLFADERVRFLEDQATDVLGSASEMGGSLSAAAEALRRHPSYPQRFAAAFRVAPDSAVTPQTVRFAIAAYVRSLVGMNSRFDQAVRGDTSVMTSEERLGFNLFMGKAKCGTCHFAPLFNGATPPMLTESEPEVIGVPTRSVTRGAKIDPDPGRWAIRRIAQHLHAFKTPTARNITLTAPYMHNGVFRTLDQVVDFYNRGGGAGIGIDIPHQTLPFDSLSLSRREQRSVVAFLRALTDTSFTAGAPQPRREVASTPPGPGPAPSDSVQ